MSEISTSPETAAEAPADASVSSVESTVPSGEMAGTTTADPIQEISTAPDTIQKEPAAPAFDPDIWDGNIETLPNDLQGPVGFLHRQLEGGYTKKFQTLSDERKAFDAEKDSWKTTNPSWEAERTSLNDELKLLRNLLGGEEDPRISEFTDKNSGLTQELADLQSEFEQFRELVEEDITEQASLYAEKFKSTHAEIFENEDKRVALSSLLDDGWSPESGVKLLDYSDKVVALAKELKDRGIPSEVAVEHAVMKFGSESTRTPRPGARLTAGAESRNNPASVKQSVNDASTAGEARLFAARAAMNWQSKNKFA